VLLGTRTPNRDIGRVSIAIESRFHSARKRALIPCRYADVLDHAVAGQDPDFVVAAAAASNLSRRNHLAIVLPRHALGHLAQTVGECIRGRQQQQKRKCQQPGTQKSAKRLAD